MAKRGRRKQKADHGIDLGGGWKPNSLNKKKKIQEPNIGIMWEKNTANGWFRPYAKVFDIRFPLEEWRPERLMLEGEREALLFYITQAMSKTLFGIEQYVATEKGIQKHEAWDKLPVGVFEEIEEDPVIVNPSGEVVKSEDNVTPIKPTESETQ